MEKKISAEGSPKVESPTPKVHKLRKSYAQNAAALVDLKLPNIINYTTPTPNPTPTPAPKAKYSYKGKAKSILTPTKIAAKKATKIIKGVATYKHNIA